MVRSHSFFSEEKGGGRISCYYFLAEGMGKKMGKDQGKDAYGEWENHIDIIEGSN